MNLTKPESHLVLKMLGEWLDSYDKTLNPIFTKKEFALAQSAHRKMKEAGKNG